MKMRLLHGPAVKHIREALGIKAGRFAVECDISPGYLSNIEAGRKQPSEEVISAMALRLGVPKDDLTYTVEASSAAPSKVGAA